VAAFALAVGAGADAVSGSGAHATSVSAANTAAETEYNKVLRIITCSLSRVGSA
jgi:hypothetical protein